MARIALGAAAAFSAAATLWLGGTFDRQPSSSAEFVSTSCRAPANASACAIALRYLAALDLDQAREVCALLESSTLENAGGMEGCQKTLQQPRGIRIRYAIVAVLRSPFGKTIRFTTRAKGETSLRQQMLVSPRGRIVAVVPEP